ncbi:MAG: hypothetical protein CVU44_03610 [Chloroflexi bacterium HGW-Chloroflexi-6]|nr:MAG: hypothetical protein CVU44_03610 [Chloroflexi bacterium HGW-Chloroflexi-6]
MNADFGKKNKPDNLTDFETRKLVAPARLSIILLAIYLIVDGVAQIYVHNVAGQRSIIFGVIALALIAALHSIILQNPARHARYQTLFAVINGSVLGIGLWFIDERNHLAIYAIFLLTATIFATIWEKRAALIFIFVSVGLSTPVSIAENKISTANLVSQISFVLIAIVFIETIFRLSNAMRTRIEQLETVNEFARKIATSLEAEQVVNIVNAALQKAINADSYYLGILEDKQLALSLLYDEGEYFSNVKLPIDGTLSGWVIEHQRPLFMPDLRHEADLEGVQLVTVGQGRTSLSWMGIPIITAHMKGILAVASYRPNAFNRTDMELLENLGQQAALALDNAYHHDEVEKQARLDSLTQVYNHGYFLKLLQKEADRARATGSSICLIMLDIDHFKQYNDSYGHMAGDLVLIEITKIITKHIHASDAVGRWGGEEFAILFPDTGGSQVHGIALRIRKEINEMILTSSDGRQLPMPTASQGIATFPDETDDIIKLVDMADQRLYIAKERGRNQIEPREEHWGKMERK